MAALQAALSHTMPAAEEEMRGIHMHAQCCLSFHASFWRFRRFITPNEHFTLIIAWLMAPLPFLTCRQTFQQAFSGRRLTR